MGAAGESECVAALSALLMMMPSTFFFMCENRA
jgi:hypothetical protein